jgi:hypothetical protein
MKRLNSGRIGLVVTTELAARGLDAPILSHAINLDLPTDATVSSKLKDTFLCSGGVFSTLCSFG